MAFDGIISLIIWQFIIPRFVVGFVQSTLYSIFIRAGDPKPAFGSHKFVKHRKLILMTLYTAYFLFSIYEITHDIQSAGNLYRDLGVPLDVDDRKLQSRFRRLTIQYHPDKINSSADRDAGNAYYVHLLEARDTIIDGVKRFAYDRFGPSVLQCGKKCLTTRDYVEHSLQGTLFQYVVFIVGLAGANALGYFNEGAYWRYLALFTLMTMETRIALRPDHPPALVNIFNPLLTIFSQHNPYLPFQIITLLRKGTYTLAIFLQLLIPLYRVQPQQADVEGEEEAIHKQLDRLAQLAKDAQVDASRLLELEIIPFKADERLKGDVRNALKGYLVNNMIHGKPEVRNAMGMSLAKRRAGAPAGARGTK
ncbi:uncharacterized protein BDZ99DRAFT_572098 [Mytilinidion resinicola]|uniref:J domain-containing protein n=1 Tax=Mytilinidion resinicola TaxID=574789 RepID=A0A6A6YHA5_9PEZI|nr:uncharacterized protein BDZ99DRAFT_572098 [Mytilinidion resinicola]KAF2808202.1 hypothetical protein BDZ99DRAFT_572098 [Mytilinidion resinicola]